MGQKVPGQVVRASHVKNDYYTNDVQFKRKLCKGFVEISRFMQIESCSTLFCSILDVCFKTEIYLKIAATFKEAQCALTMFCYDRRPLGKMRK